MAKQARPLADGTPFLMRSGTSAERSQKYEIMARWATKLRASRPTMKYAEMIRAVRIEYRVGISVAEAVVTRAAELLREAFNEFCADAPRIIFDAYLSLYDESIKSIKDLDEEIAVAEKGRLAGLHRMRRSYVMSANRTLDSVRDTFGMRGTINVRLLGGAKPPDELPDEAFDALTDAQLESLAKLDQLAPGIIDAESSSVGEAIGTAASAAVDVADDMDWEDDDADV